MCVIVWMKSNAGEARANERKELVIKLQHCGTAAWRPEFSDEGCALAEFEDFIKHANRAQLRVRLQQAREVLAQRKRAEEEFAHEWMEMKMNQLRTECKSRKLDQWGTFDVLQARLQESYKKEALENFRINNADKQ